LCGMVDAFLRFAASSAMVARMMTVALRKSESHIKLCVGITKAKTDAPSASFDNMGYMKPLRVFGRHSASRM
jgi:hypothetical protein